MSVNGEFLHFIHPFQFLDSPEWDSLRPSEEGVFQVRRRPPSSTQGGLEAGVLAWTEDVSTTLENLSRDTAPSIHPSLHPLIPPSTHPSTHSSLLPSLSFLDSSHGGQGCS